MNESIISGDTRKSTINNIYLHVNKKKISQEIENGIYNYCIDYCRINNTLQYLIETYKDKSNDIIDNLDTKNNDINNKYLLSEIKNKNIDPQNIAFMKPYELNPPNWKIITDRRKLIEDKKTNIATTDRYRCRKCGVNKCTIYQFQTRSCDEPITTFVTCITCGNGWKF